MVEEQAMTSEEVPVAADPHRPATSGYRRPEDACLARAADAVRFDLASPADHAAGAVRRVDPLRTVLAGLLRGIGTRRRR